MSSASPSSRSKKDQLPIDVLINCILVKERVRPAMLVQPQDYREATSADPKTKRILRNIRKLFPDLEHSESYEVYQGIIISYEDFNDREISLSEMGKLLGYPCYSEFNTINRREQVSYGIHVTVNFEDGETANLLANVCKNTSKLPEFQAFAEAAEEVLKREEYVEMIGKSVENVEVTTEKDLPTKAIINMIINKELITNSVKSQIYNIYYNFSFSEEFEGFCEEHFQYNNPVHMGILLSLLCNQRNDTLSPFYPLQEYPEEHARVNETIESWEKDLMDIILRTKIKSKSNSKTRRRYHSI